MLLIILIFYAYKVETVKSSNLRTESQVTTTKLQ